MALAQAVTAAAPWYAPYVTAGCFVVTGAMVGAMSTYLSDRRKHKRDDRLRWDASIWETSATVIALCLQLKEVRIRLGRFDERVAAALQVDDDQEIKLLSGEAPKSLELTAEIERLRGEADHALAALSCIAPHEVWESAFTLANVVTKIGTPVTEDERQAAVDAVGIAQGDLLTKVRFAIDAKGNDRYKQGRWKAAMAEARQKVDELMKEKQAKQNRP